MVKIVGIGLMLGFSMLLIGSQASKAYLNAKPIIVPQTSQSAPLVRVALASVNPAPKAIWFNEPKPIRSIEDKARDGVAIAPIVEQENTVENSKVSLRSQYIVISISEQRLYAYENNQLRWALICSTALTGISLPMGEEADTPHNHFGTFSILDKDKDKYSKTYKVAMPYSLHYYGGHYIHATHEIKHLGTPASHGCVRLRLSDAKKLYDWAMVGDAIIIVL